MCLEWCMVEHPLTDTAHRQEPLLSGQWTLEWDPKVSTYQAFLSAVVCLERLWDNGMKVCQDFWCKTIGCYTKQPIIKDLLFEFPRVSPCNQLPTKKSEEKGIRRVCMFAIWIFFWQFACSCWIFFLSSDLTHCNNNHKDYRKDHLLNIDK